MWKVDSKLSVKLAVPRKIQKEYGLDYGQSVRW